MQFCFQPSHSRQSEGERMKEKLKENETYIHRVRLIN